MKLVSESKKGRVRVHGVEALGLGLGKKHLLDGDNFEARLVHFRKNIGREAFADRVGLDDAESSLHTRTPKRFHKYCDVVRVAMCRRSLAERLRRGSLFRLHHL